MSTTPRPVRAALYVLVAAVAIQVAHALVGYQASVPAPGISRLSDLAGLLQVHAHDGATGDAFRLAGPLAKKLEGGGSQA